MLTSDEKANLIQLGSQLSTLDEAERKNVYAYINGAAMAAENRKAAGKDEHTAKESNGN